MTSEVYFPEQRHMIAYSLVRRERVMPEAVREVRVEVGAGARLTLKDVIARGTAPAPYTVLEAAKRLRLSKPDDLERYLTAALGDVVGANTPVAARGRRRVLTPVSGRVVAVEDGLIIVQATADTYELEAGLNGQVLEVVKGHGAVVETIGAVLQGVWGNDRRAVGTLHMEPNEGLDAIETGEMDIQYRGAIVVTRRPLTESVISRLSGQSYLGIIAPSMQGNLIESAKAASQAILLTEGFGSLRMTPQIAQFLSELDGRQTTVDAMTPTTGERRRPELIVNTPMQMYERPGAPLTNLHLQVGMAVRLLHGEGENATGIMGQIVALPKTPVMLENGLRVDGAQVELVTGEKLFVPLANIEINGR